MPWVVGIDEAGYGPNLGPLVQAAVAVRLPDDEPSGWDALRANIRRCGEEADTRALVDDSKRVHSGSNALARLEQGLAAVVGMPAGSFADWLATITSHHVLADLSAEAWFDGSEAIPLHADSPAYLGLDARIVGVRMVPAALFNKIVAGSGSKATVLAVGLNGLLAVIRDAIPIGESVLVICDKLGGRNCYTAQLQSAFHDGWVVTEVESADESRYRIESLGRDFRVVFRPRADSASVSVALASMLAKYLREVCMRQFNRFWISHIPELKPTAGYPSDAKRYYDAIRPAMEKLGIAEEAVWRSR